MNSEKWGDRRACRCDARLLFTSKYPAPQAAESGQLRSVGRSVGRSVSSGTDKEGNNPESQVDSPRPSLHRYAMSSYYPINHNPHASRESCSEMRTRGLSAQRSSN